MKKRNQWKKLLLRAGKIAVGSSAAIYVAHLLNLEYAASAGSIALLTIVTTKWETLRLSLFRVLSFLVAVLIGWLCFTHMHEWVAYGVFIFAIVIFCEVVGWKAAMSVNAVIGTHFLSTLNFTRDFIWNEFLLVLIGITIAILLNLFHGNNSQKNEIVQYMRRTEADFQKILKEMASYLEHEKMGDTVWADIVGLEKQLEEYLNVAHEYHNNTFQSHPVYYIEYFEMRSNQCKALHNLHYEMKKIRNMPRQAKVIADYILYLTEFVVEMNVPSQQIERLEGIFADMKKEPLPVTREEFESRAMLYHILMDLEEFLIFKKRFVEEMDSKVLEYYWKKEIK